MGEMDVCFVCKGAGEVLDVADDQFGNSTRFWSPCPACSDMDDPAEEMEISGTCNICRKRETFSVKRQDYHDWEQGKKLIQEAMPYLSAAQRELLITGTCNTCWESMFNIPEDEDFDDIL